MDKYSVTEFTEIISEVIDEAVPVAWIEGEVSRFKRYPSGHCYFTIKDANSAISAVIWSTYAQKMESLPKEGEKALFFGKAKVFEKRGQYQFSIFNYAKVGQGNINQDLDQLKKRLSDEGLFDESLKKPIQKIPETVAIVTGEGSAALSDVIKVLQHRCPYVEVKLFYTVVQGNTNDVKVIDALKKVEKYSHTKKKIDTVLLVRGGGSVEDLWLFNSEKLVRFISSFSIPLISGIGHEIDHTLVDFVSDLRAPTPSVAAEKCAVDIQDVWHTIDFHYDTMQKSIENRALEVKNKIAFYNEKFKSHIIDSKVKELKNRREKETQNITTKMNDLLKDVKNRFQLHNQAVENLNPEHIFKLGFSAIHAKKSGKSIKSIKNVEVGTDIKVILHDGNFFANVKEVAGE